LRHVEIGQIDLQSQMTTTMTMMMTIMTTMMTRGWHGGRLHVAIAAMVNMIANIIGRCHF